ncbi:DegQ family serine endoprotease [Magnetospira sp. QH-2]|uniref:DegQ family serine endoprotease n=1 Tax=Magnetospira sp. (strain QH-2) TaxID=1288970 RepID=UPI0003E80C89|nr:DegQ family serine endoprotease [Magnetospira sp. QH-2]CCQ74578.1 putative serine protease (DegP periplasmic, membrane-associated serine endoprotease, protease Do), containing two PDZ domains [Magnetospira sp. QH-2]
MILRYLIPVVLAIFLLAGPAQAKPKWVPSDKAEMQMSFAPLVKHTAPAVVNIYTRKVVRTRRQLSLFDDPFFRRFFGDLGMPRGNGGSKKKIQNSLGSGVILRPDGIVVTNNHVIEGADEITVVLADRREFDAEILGSDERTDIAVLQLKTDGENLPHLEFKDSDELEVGDLVLAIGNPFGVGQTVTSGIVSGLARTQVGISDYNSFIQTDAAINPGNSGGALVGIDGRLVGINTAIFSKSGGSHGIGFAIPANMVKVVVRQLTSDGKLVRPWFGASGQRVTADIAASLGLDRPAGVLINDVWKKGPADRGNLKVGDVVLSVNGKTVDDPESLKFRIATLEVGGKAKLDIWRRDRHRTLRIPLSPAPEEPGRDETELEGRSPLSGAVVVNLSPAVVEEMGLANLESGVVITKIRRGSSAHRFEFKPADRILAINQARVESVDKLRRMLRQRTESWRITLNRDGRNLSLVIR